MSVSPDQAPASILKSSAFIVRGAPAWGAAQPASTAAKMTAPATGPFHQIEYPLRPVVRIAALPSEVVNARARAATAIPPPGARSVPAVRFRLESYKPPKRPPDDSPCAF